MPTVLRIAEFRVQIFTHDHTPPHVHVVTPNGVIVIDLAVDGAEQSTRRVSRSMPQSERRGAFRLVANNTSYLRDRWREIHG